MTNPSKSWNMPNLKLNVLVLDDCVDSPVGFAALNVVVLDVGFGLVGDRLQRLVLQGGIPPMRVPVVFRNIRLSRL